MSDALAPATPPSPKAEMQGGEMAEALEAARRIVGGWQRSLSQSGYWEEGDPLRVARALLSAPKDNASRDDVLEATEAADDMARILAQQGHNSSDYDRARNRCHAAIRALKEKPHV